MKAETNQKSNILIGTILNGLDAYLYYVVLSKTYRQNLRMQADKKLCHSKDLKLA